ncbi:MAG: dihydrofolate reductase [Pseudomonadota bacterium]
MTGPRIALVVAMARNGVIGAGNALPWRLPEDLKHFKALTMGHCVVMGRKTFDSIGKLLPGRQNVIVTRRADYAVSGARVVHSVEEALESCERQDEIFVIGGAELFRDLIDRADRMYVTELMQDFEGDVYFPAYDRSAWREVSRERRRAGDLEYHFVVYERAR